MLLGIQSCSSGANQDSSHVIDLFICLMPARENSSCHIRVTARQLLQTYLLGRRARNDGLERP